MAPRAREVTVGGLTRVAAVVAELAEAAAEASLAGEADQSAPLDDLIAKAAVAVEGTVGQAQSIRRRAAAQRTRSKDSIKAATEAAQQPPPGRRTLDVTR